MHMVGKQSNDSDVTKAAEKALQIIDETLSELPAAKSYDYGGHILAIGEYDVCTLCTKPIAEAQSAYDALEMRAAHTDDTEIKEHIEMAAELFKKEAETAVIRAELHNGRGSEKIIDHINGFLHDHNVRDDYNHSHNGGK